MPCPQAAQRSYAHLHHRSPRVSFWVPRCPDVRIYVVYNTDGGCKGNMIRMFSLSDYYLSLLSLYLPFSAFTFVRLIRGLFIIAQTGRGDHNFLLGVTELHVLLVRRVVRVIAVSRTLRD